MAGDDINKLSGDWEYKDVSDYLEINTNTQSNLWEILSKEQLHQIVVQSPYITKERAQYIKDYHLKEIAQDFDKIKSCKSDEDLMQYLAHMRLNDRLIWRVDILLWYDKDNDEKPVMLNLDKVKGRSIDVENKSYIFKYKDGTEIEYLIDYFDKREEDILDSIYAYYYDKA